MKTIKLFFAIFLLMFVTLQVNAQCGPCEDWVVENKTDCDIELLWYRTVACMSSLQTATVSAGTLPAHSGPVRLSAPCVQVGDCGTGCPTGLDVWQLPNPDYYIPANGPLQHMRVQACGSCPTGYIKASYTPGNPHTLIFACE